MSFGVSRGDRDLSPGQDGADHRGALGERELRGAAHRRRAGFERFFGRGSHLAMGQNQCTRCRILVMEKAN